MRRRHLLGALGLAITTLLADRTAWGRPWRPAGGPARKLTGALGRPRSAARVGRAYLAGHPGEAAVDHLVEALVADLRQHDCVLDCAQRTEIRATLGHLIRDDFAHQRVVSVDGWVLSRSEARLYALAALA